MATENSLEKYRRKRNFQKTTEPAGDRQGARAARRKPRFVIQQHDASTMHYDFRLELGGVLKSWAVPKGLSTDPREKRLAVQTEDHPLGYAAFEGVIPEGEYGAGAVIVWDRGTYRNLKDDIPMERALCDGHATIWLEGEKLRGGYALIRIGKPKKDSWLIIKMADEEADARRNPVRTQQKSVLTGRSVKQTAREKDYGTR